MTPWTPLLFGVLLLPPSFTFDRTLRNELAEPGGFGRKGTFFELAGRGEASAAVAGALYLGGAAAGSSREKKAAVVAAQATLANAAATAGLKFIAGRERPTADNGPGRWHPFDGDASGRNSFPSGHTSNAFALAAALTESYESPWFAAGAYGLAATAGASRIASNKHWTSDVVAGAVLGYAVGKGVARWHEGSGWGRRLYTDGRGVFLSFAF